MRTAMNDASLPAASELALEEADAEAGLSRQTCGAVAEAPAPERLFFGIRHTFLVPLIVACALFMEQMDSTVITTALPLIARDFGRDPLVLKMGLSAYLVSLAVFIPISGWIADRFGSRRVFCAAIGLFMASSMACGAARTFGFFVVMRFIQGIGGAMMVPVGRVVIVRSVPKEDLVTAFIYLTAPAALGPLSGPILGGFIATYFNWRWIFYINVPMSIIGIVLARHFMREFREDKVPPVDLIGFLLSAAGLSLFMFGLSTITDKVLPRLLSAGAMAAGALIVFVYFLRSRHEEKPLLDFRFFRLKTFMVGVGGGMLFRYAFGASVLLIPLMLQLGFGLSPFRSGLLTCSTALGALCIRTITKWLLRQFGFRNMLGYNALLSAATIAGLGLITARTPHWLIFLVLLVGGGFRIMQFTALNTIAYAEVPASDVSQATSLFATMQQLSIGIGVTLGAFCLEGSNWIQGHRHIVAADFWPAFLVVALFSVVSAHSAFSLSPDAGADMAGRTVAGS
jgi:EmrB/QacA subfamily drug resistance transporter